MNKKEEMFAHSHRALRNQLTIAACVLPEAAALPNSPLSNTTGVLEEARYETLAETGQAFRNESINDLELEAGVTVPQLKAWG